MASAPGQDPVPEKGPMEAPPSDDGSSIDDNSVGNVGLVNLDSSPDDSSFSDDDFFSDDDSFGDDGSSSDGGSSVGVEPSILIVLDPDYDSANLVRRRKVRVYVDELVRSDDEEDDVFSQGYRYRRSTDDEWLTDDEMSAYEESPTAPEPASSEANSSSDAKSPILKLPPEVLQKILGYLTFHEVMQRYLF